MRITFIGFLLLDGRKTQYGLQLPAAGVEVEPDMPVSAFLGSYPHQAPDGLLRLRTCMNCAGLLVIILFVDKLAYIVKHLLRRFI